MGLTARDFGEVSRLAALAGNPRGLSRDDIYRSVASLYQNQGAVLSDRERELMRDILSRLAADVEMAIRVAIAEKIADDGNAPLDLILFLVEDKIEVARPLILRSRRLTDYELLKFLREADVARQALCAERPNIGEPVTQALASSDAEPVLVALVRNVTAQIGERTFATLVEKSRSIAVLQQPLADRSDLPPHLAGKMCEWVSESLKACIVQRYQMSLGSASSVVDGAVHALYQPSDTNDGTRKLIDKLAAASQLKPGFLLRVLHQGQIDLFELAFAKLLGIGDSEIRRVLYESGPRHVALACRAVGIDRCVFPTVYTLSRQARRIQPQLSPNDRADIEAVFAAYSRPEALARVQTSAW